MAPAIVYHPIEWAIQRLTAAEVDVPRLEAQLLLGLALGITRTAVIGGLFEPLSEEKQKRFVQLVEARAAHVPLAYLRGTQEFYGLEFEVSPAVLIPRPETEMLVDFALERLSRSGPVGDSQSATAIQWHNGSLGRPPARRVPANAGGEGRQSRPPTPNSGGEGLARRGPTSDGRPPTPNSGGEGLARRYPDTRLFADVGTGSGCIAIAALVHCPGSRCVAFDLSSDALQVATGNAARHGVLDRIELVQGDLFRNSPIGQFDLILSNPPYVATGELHGLQAEVRISEPRMALDGGPDGLDLYRRLVPASLLRLTPGGALAVEVGMGQACDVAEVFERNGFCDIEIRKDLAGIERLVAGCRPGSVSTVKPDAVMSVNTETGEGVEWQPTV
jgi:release factor glutamine methyltransferase